MRFTTSQVRIAPGLTAKACNLRAQTLRAAPRPRTHLFSGHSIRKAVPAHSGGTRECQFFAARCVGPDNGKGDPVSSRGPRLGRSRRHGWRGPARARSLRSLFCPRYEGPGSHRPPATNPRREVGAQCLIGEREIRDQQSPLRLLVEVESNRSNICQIDDVAKQREGKANSV